MFLSVGWWNNHKSGLPGTNVVLKTYSMEGVMEVFVPPFFQSYSSANTASTLYSGEDGGWG